MELVLGSSLDRRKAVAAMILLCFGLIEFMCNGVFWNSLQEHQQPPFITVQNAAAQTQHPEVLTAGPQRCSSSREPVAQPVTSLRESWSAHIPSPPERCLFSSRDSSSIRDPADPLCDSHVQPGPLGAPRSVSRTPILNGRIPFILCEMATLLRDISRRMPVPGSSGRSWN